MTPHNHVKIAPTEMMLLLHAQHVAMILHNHAKIVQTEMILLLHVMLATAIAATLSKNPISLLSEINLVEYSFIKENLN
jgi:chemotaxis protein CheY-P-specific phosphatase CheC